VEYTPHEGVTSLVAVVAPRTGKTIKNVFVGGENLLQNGIHFVFRLRQSVRNRIAKEEFTQTKNFSKKGLVSKQCFQNIA